MPPPGQSDAVDTFIAELDRAFGRISRCDESTWAAKIESEAEKYGSAEQQDFARSYLSLRLQGATGALTPSTMKPKEYFMLLGGALGFLVVLLLLAFLVSLGVGHYLMCLSVLSCMVFFIGIPAISLVVRNPSGFQKGVFRTYLALAAAAAGAGLPGFVTFQEKSTSVEVSAGGALALFLIVFFWNPVGATGDKES
jgi:hypothetical protein